MEKKPNRTDCKTTLLSESSALAENFARYCDKAYLQVCREAKRAKGSLNAGYAKKGGL